MKSSSKKLTWKKAFMATDGPNNLKEALILYLKGIAMGTADIIPGVSGGTIAFITGIYETLIKSIKSINANTINLFFKGRLKEMLSLVNVRFLIVLFAGIITSILSLARLMNYVLIEYPIYTWSLFFGLIGASILIMNKKFNWNINSIIVFILGALSGYALVSVIPVQTPDEIWFIFICGFIAICAMILPGISGSFLLLILGKYEYITGLLKAPFEGNNLLVICIFVLGCVSGLAGFSRFLNWLFDKWHNATIAFLTGLMLGSMKKIWPWKETLETKIIEGKTYVLKEKNIIPSSIDESVLFAILLMIIGFIIVMLIEKTSEEN